MVFPREEEKKKQDGKFEMYQYMCHICRRKRILFVVPCPLGVCSGYGRWVDGIRGWLCILLVKCTKSCLLYLGLERRRWVVEVKN